MKKKFDNLILITYLLLIIVIVYGGATIGTKYYKEYMNKPGVVIKDGVQIATIIVNEIGYEPQSLKLKPNIPTKINFYTDETATCSRQVTSKQLNFFKTLYNNESEIIDVGKLEPGTYKYQCGMGMHTGELKVITE
ncbi:MAG: hypothetical protein K0S34_313 [Bacillales bacterium]|jgi:plastocyanin domain-containing protein|nr:hypothetical protein [Bacillales bacterium]